MYWTISTVFIIVLALSFLAVARFNKKIKLTTKLMPPRGGFFYLKLIFLYKIR